MSQEFKASLANIERHCFINKTETNREKKRRPEKNRNQNKAIWESKANPHCKGFLRWWGERVSQRRQDVSRALCRISGDAEKKVGHVKGAMDYHEKTGMKRSCHGDKGWVCLHVLPLGNWWEISK